VPKDSIAVVTHVGVGKLVYLRFPYTTSQDFVSLSELKADAAYLCFAIHKKLQSELHMVQGSAIKGITKDELLSKKIALPDMREQHRVGASFFAPRQPHHPSSA
jgi:type I restriction enzyme S subunit